MKRAEISKKLGPVVKAAMKKHDVPGVSVGIRIDGDDHAFGYGVTNIDFPLPVDGDTLFQIGSTTKTFTGTLIMTLVDEGKIDLEAPVITYLPGFKLTDDSVTSQVLVRHLLTHTGGWLGDYFDNLGRGADALKKIVARMAKKTPQLTPVGEVWSYNNSGFYVAGRLIEVLTRKPYEEVVAERIFKPLGMDRSFFFVEDVIGYKTALGHVHGVNGLKVARPWGLPRNVNPAGGIVSTAPDQLRYAAFHLGDGTAPDGTKVLSSESLDRMKEPLAPAGSLADQVGITWLLEDMGKTRIVKHGGSINGQMSAFLLVPERDFAMTVLTNGDRGHDLDHEVTSFVLAELLGVKPAVKKPKRLTAAQTADYVGRYRMPSGHVVVTAAPNGRLRAETVFDPEVIERNPDAVAALPPPSELGVVGDDRAVTVGPNDNGRRVEFVRGADGAVEWIRTGGRIYRKVDE